MSDKNKLRVFHGPEDASSVPLSAVDATARTVQVPLQLIWDTFGDGVQKKLAWVEDFRDEKVAVSTDLY